MFVPPGDHVYVFPHRNVRRQGLRHLRSLSSTVAKRRFASDPSANRCRCCEFGNISEASDFSVCELGGPVMKCRPIPTGSNQYSTRERPNRGGVQIFDPPNTIHASSREANKHKTKKKADLGGASMRVLVPSLFAATALGFAGCAQTPEDRLAPRWSTVRLCDGNACSEQSTHSDSAARLKRSRSNFAAEICCLFSTLVPITRG